MDIKYAILGLIQGITEPIPVSSSGHLQIFKSILNFENIDLNFDIIVNFGSLLAILIIFRKDLIKLISNFFNYIFGKKNLENKLNFKYCLLIIMATIPVGVIGFIFKDLIEDNLKNINFLAISFIVTSISLFLVRKIKGSKDDHEITYKDALIIGLLQTLAVLPGLSRSGITLVGCLFRDLKREAALKFTFLLYIPVSLATFGLSLYEILSSGNLSFPFLSYFVGLLISFLGTLFSYNILTRLIKNGKIVVFAIYCLLVSGFILIFL